MNRRLIFSVALCGVLTATVVTVAPRGAAADAAASDQGAACRTAYDPIKTPGPATVFKRVACVAGFITPATGEVPIGRSDIAAMIGDFINIVLSFTGVVFIVLIIYGGWLWGTAEGNEEQIDKAEDLIRNAIIGIIITFSAFAVSHFVLTGLGTILQPS